jgi:hypothetical protein
LGHLRQTIQTLLFISVAKVYQLTIVKPAIQTQHAYHAISPRRITQTPTHSTITSISQVILNASQNVELAIILIIPQVFALYVLLLVQHANLLLQIV